MASYRQWRRLHRALGGTSPTFKFVPAPLVTGRKLWLLAPRVFSVARLELRKANCMGKLDGGATKRWRKVYPKFSRFDIVEQCDRWADGRTTKRTVGQTALPYSIDLYCACIVNHASSGKKASKMPTISDSIINPVYVVGRFMRKL